MPVSCNIRSLNENDFAETTLEIHMKETKGVLIMQLSLQLSMVDKVICYSTFCDEQFI